MKDKLKKQFLEIGIFLLVIFIIYITGLQTEIAGFLQRGIMLTGIHNASAEFVPERKEADLNFNLQTLDGKKLTVSSLKGKTVFINFWATWCPPCIAEMPEIQSLWEEIAADDIVFLMVSTEKETDKIKSFIQRKNFTFPVYQLVSALPADLVSNSIPTVFVIAPDGNIVYKNTGMANYNTDSFKKFLNQVRKGV